MRIKSMATLKRKPRVKREQPEHIAFVAWFKRNFPDIIIHHSANGEARDSDPILAKIRGKLLQLMGVFPGFYDLFIPEWFLFIEMKPVKGGYLSVNQKYFKEHMERIGYGTFKANGCDDAIEKLHLYLKGDIPKLQTTTKE